MWGEMLVWLKQSHSDQFMYFSVKRKNNNNEKKKNLHSHFPLVRPYLWKYLQYYHYLFHFYWIFFCISISSSSHNLPSPVLLWLDRTLDITHELASGWPQRRSRITNAPGSRIKTHLSFFIHTCQPSWFSLTAPVCFISLSWFPSGVPNSPTFANFFPHCIYHSLFLALCSV